MKITLSEEELSDRRKKNQKTLKIIGFLLILLSLLIIFLTFDENEKKISNPQDALKQKNSLDSVIKVIKNDKNYKINKIEYLADSTLKIYLKSNSKFKTKAAGFDALFNILEIGNVSQIEVYLKNEIQSSYGLKSANQLENFKKQFVSSYDGSCQPVVVYIKDKMNDPSSFEHVNTSINPLLNGDFEINTKFREKNSYGAIVLSNSNSVVSPNGQILSFIFD